MEPLLVGLLIATAPAVKAMEPDYVPGDPAMQQKACDDDIERCAYDPLKDCIPGMRRSGAECRPPEACPATAANPAATCGAAPTCPVGESDNPSCAPTSPAASSACPNRPPIHGAGQAGYSCDYQHPDPPPGCAGYGGTWANGTCEGIDMLQLVQPRSRFQIQNYCDSAGGSVFGIAWLSAAMSLPADYEHDGEPMTWRVYFEPPYGGAYLIGSWTLQESLQHYAPGNAVAGQTYRAWVEYDGPEGFIASSTQSLVAKECADSWVHSVSASPASACVPYVAVQVRVADRDFQETVDLQDLWIFRHEVSTGGARTGGPRFLEVPLTHPLLTVTASGSFRDYEYHDYTVEAGRRYEYAATADYGPRGHRILDPSTSGLVSATVDSCGPPVIFSIRSQPTAPGFTDAPSGLGQANTREASIHVQWRWGAWEDAMDWHLKSVALYRNEVQPAIDRQDHLDAPGTTPNPRAGHAIAYFVPRPDSAILEFKDYDIRGDRSYQYYVVIERNGGRPDLVSNAADSHIATAPHPVAGFHAEALPYLHKDYPGGPHEGQPAPPGGYPMDLLERPSAYGEIAFRLEPSDPDNESAATHYEVNVRIPTRGTYACIYTQSELLAREQSFVFPHDFATDSRHCAYTGQRPSPFTTDMPHAYAKAYAYNAYGRSPATVIPAIAPWDSRDPDGRHTDATSDPSHNARAKPYEERTATWSREDAIHHHIYNATNSLDEEAGFADDGTMTGSLPKRDAEDPVDLHVDAVPCEADGLLVIYSYHALGERVLGYRGPNLPNHRDIASQELYLYAVDRHLVSYDDQAQDPGEPVQRFHDAWTSQQSTGEMDWQRLNATPLVTLKRDVATGTRYGFDAYSEVWPGLYPDGRRLPFNGAGAFCLMDGVIALADPGTLNGIVAAYDYLGGSQVVHEVVRGPVEPEVQAMATRLDLGGSGYGFRHEVSGAWSEVMETYDVHGHRRARDCHCTHQTLKATTETHTLSQSFASRYNHYLELRDEGTPNPVAGSASVNFNDETGLAAGASFSKYQRFMDARPTNGELGEILRINQNVTPRYERWDERDTVDAPNEASPPAFNPDGDARTVLQPWIRVAPDLGLTLRGQTGENGDWLAAGNARPVAIVGGIHAFHREAVRHLGLNWTFTYQWSKSPIQDGQAPHFQAVPADPQHPWMPEASPMTNSEYRQLGGRLAWHVEFTARLVDPTSNVAYDVVRLNATTRFLYDRLSLADIEASDIGIPVFKQDTVPSGAPYLRGFWYTLNPAPWEKVANPSAQGDSIYHEAGAVSSTIPRGFGQRLQPINALQVENPEPDDFFLRIHPSSTENAWDPIRKRDIEDTRSADGAVQVAAENRRLRGNDTLLVVHYTISPSDSYGDGEARVALKLYDVAELHDVFGYLDPAPDFLDLDEPGRRDEADPEAGRGFLTADGTGLLVREGMRFEYRFMSSMSEVLSGTQRIPGNPPPRHGRIALGLEYSDGTLQLDSQLDSGSTPYSWTDRTLTPHAGKTVTGIVLVAEPFVDESWDNAERAYRFYSLYLDFLRLDYQAPGQEPLRFHLYDAYSTHTPEVELAPEWSRNEGPLWYHALVSSPKKYNSGFDAAQPCQYVEKTQRTSWLIFQRTSYESQEGDCDSSSGQNPLFFVHWTQPWEDYQPSNYRTANPYFVHGLVAGVASSGNQSVLDCLRYSTLSEDQNSITACLQEAAQGGDSRDPTLRCIQLADERGKGDAGAAACLRDHILAQGLSESPFLRAFGTSDQGGLGGPGNYYPHRGNYDRLWETATFLSFQEPDSAAEAPRYELVLENWGHDGSHNERALQQVSPSHVAAKLLESPADARAQENPVYGHYAPSDDRRRIVNLDGTQSYYTGVPEGMLDLGVPVAVAPVGAFWDVKPDILDPGKPLVLDLNGKASWTRAEIRDWVALHYDARQHDYLLIKPYATQLDVCYQWEGEEEAGWWPATDLGNATNIEKSERTHANSDGEQVGYKLRLRASLIIFMDTVTERAKLATDPCRENHATTPVQVDGRPLGAYATLVLLALDTTYDDEGTARWIIHEGAQMVCDTGGCQLPSGGSTAGRFDQVGEGDYYHDFGHTQQVSAPPGHAFPVMNTIFTFEPYKAPTFRLILDYPGWEYESARMEEGDFGFDETKGHPSWWPLAVPVLVALLVVWAMVRLGRFIGRRLHA